MSNILAIDASLSSTGWAVLDEETKEVINCGKICTKKNDKLEQYEDEDNRITYISRQLLSICLNNNIGKAAEEAQFMHKNAKTGMQLSRLRGGISVLLSLANVKIQYIAPMSIKKIITGSGSSDKEAVYEVIINRYKNNEIVKNIGPYSDKQTKKIEKTSDIYDAISIGLAA